MKKTIAVLLLAVMLVAVLASCNTQTTTVKVRFVTWEDADVKKEAVIYETELQITTSNPTLYTVLEQAKLANAEIAPVYGEAEDGSITPPTEYFGKKEGTEGNVKYSWAAYCTAADVKLDDKTAAVKDDEWTNVVADGSVVTFVYLWFEMSKD